MTAIFLNIVNISIAAGWIVLAVLVLRLLLKKAPRWITVLLWGIVAVRLLCPFSIESVMSLIPSAETISPTILVERDPAIDSGVPLINEAVNPLIEEAFTPKPLSTSRFGTPQFWMSAFATLWLVGMAVMLLYTAVSYRRLRKTVGEAVLLRDNIFQSERVLSPFVLGLVKPTIYLPFGIGEQDMAHVIAHEQAHIRRRDHWIKPLGFLLLTVHWFNPLMWLGYVLLCRDIELACDEKVIQGLDRDGRADYSEVLLSCSVHRRRIAACPLAFGEVGVKSRVKSVLNYKKPAFWIMVTAIVVAAVVAVCFLTNPKRDDIASIQAQTSGSSVEGVSLEILTFDLSASDPYLAIQWTNNSEQEILFKEEFTIYRYVGGEWVDCRGRQEVSWGLATRSVRQNETSTQRYSLNSLSMAEAGTYRFEAPLHVAGSGEWTHAAWIDFELTHGIAGTTVLTLQPTTLVYDHGSYSYVQSAEAAPTYRITSGMQLYEIDRNGIAHPLGTLGRMPLDEEHFDSRFSTSNDAWLTHESLKSLKKNNYRAWQFAAPSEERFAPLYILLQQQDGTFYLGVGYHRCQSNEPPNPDDSHVRWLYKLKKVAVSETVSEHIVQNGAIFFYSKATLENSTPTLTKFYQMPSPELTEVLSVLEGKRWYSDAFMDRMLYHFDGQLYYEGKWLYFGYESGAFYYDGYLCEGATDAIALIKAAYKKADPYDANREMLNSDDIDAPADVTDEEIARLSKLYPNYFDLSTDNGLTVLIDQNYHCYLSSTDAVDGRPTARGLSIREMRIILSTYNIDKTDVTVCPVINPLLSYSVTIDDTYREQVENLFWARLDTLPTE